MSLRGSLGLATLFVLGAPGASPAAPAPLQAQAPAGAHVGLCVLDAETGAVLRRQDADKSFTPASVMKLFTAYAALDVLGPTYTTETTLSRPAPQGSEGLVATGGGDPLLKREDLAGLARQARQAGLRRLDGKLRLAPGRFAPVPEGAAERYPAGWTVDDLPWGYAAPTGSWVLDRNAIGPASDPRAVAEPRRLAGGALLAALARAGVAGGSGVAETPASASGPVLAAKASAPLADWVRVMNRESDNLVAETVLLHLGGRGTIAEARERGLARLKASLAEADVPLAGCRFVDGSGLSRYALATPDALARLLVSARKRPWIGGPLMASLPQAGLSGTLAGRLAEAPARGRVRAKTGTMGGVTCLAGYLEPPSGRTLAFALMLNHPASTSAARAYLDAVVQELIAP